jgi:DNA-binding transcriptional LysR family regulator
VQAHCSSQVVDLQGGGYDVAVRASIDLEPGLVQRVLAREPLCAVASPRYLEQHGHPRTLRDLRAHRCLLGFARGELPQTYWPLSAKRKLHVEGVFCSNEITLLCSAAVRGLGIAYLPALLVRPLIEHGQLEHVLPNWLRAESQIAVVYAERAFVPAPVRAFVDAVVAWAPKGLASALHAQACAMARDKPKARTAAK